MSVPGLCDGWRDDDAPLRPCDINWGTLERDMRESEDAIAASAWDPGAGDVRPLYDTWSHRERTQDQVIFEDEFRAYMKGR